MQHPDLSVVARSDSAPEMPEPCRGWDRARFTGDSDTARCSRELSRIRKRTESQSELTPELTSDFRFPAVVHGSAQACRFVLSRYAVGSKGNGGLLILVTERRQGLAILRNRERARIGRFENDLGIRMDLLFPL